MKSIFLSIKQKRLGYLHVLLNASDDALSKNVFLEQLKHTIQGDWVKYMKQDLKELDIKMRFEEIGLMTRAKWKKLIKNKIREACFRSLIVDKQKLSKGKEIQYDKLETQLYFKPGNALSAETKRRIFKVRSRDLWLKCNFPHAFSDLQCVTGCDQNNRDDQKHLFYCSVLSGNSVMSNTVQYEDIFQQKDVSKQEQVVSIIYDHFKKRNKIVSPDS